MKKEAEWLEPEWKPLTGLPAKYSHLLNPDKPLARPDRFINYELSFNAVAYGIGAAIWVASIGLLVPQLISSETYANWELMDFVFLLFFFVPFLFIIKRLIQNFQIMKSNKTGKYRDGLFVLDTGLLFVKKKKFLEVPRKNIQDIYIRKKHIEGAHNLYSLIIKAAIKDRNYIVDLTGLEFGARNDHALHAIQEWHKFRKWKRPQ